MKQFFSVLTIGFCAVAHGADYYVATNGSDAAAGTLGAPFETIQHGVDLLVAGDTLHVRGGSYHEAVLINGLIGSGGGAVWSGGSGWSGAWTLGADTTTASYSGNTCAYMVRDGSITRTLASGVSGGTLSFKWDVDSLDTGGGGDVAYVEIYDGSWHQVWLVDNSDNGGDINSGVPDALTSTNISLSTYGTVTQVRFRIDANGGGDHFFVDDVQLGTASHDFEPSTGSGIAIQSYQDEVVTIDGTESISTSWTAVSNNIYKTTFATDIWQLFVDDEMQTSARWPDAEAWTDATWDKDANWIQQDALSTNGIFVDESGGQELATTGKDFTGAIAVMNIGSWLSFAETVTSHGAGSDSFTYSPIPANNYHHKIENGAAFFEAAYACLSTNKEWYYDSGANELFLIADNGLSPVGRDIRGKTITYGLDIQSSQDITVQGIDFFACTFRVNNSDSITIENSDVLFPSYSKRMLGNTAKADATYIDGDGNTLKNCTFQYADGSGIEFVGDGGLIENCLFHQIDYSCVGTLHDVMVNIRNATNLDFRQNTLDTGGNSVGIKGGDSSVFELNRVTNQGMLQHDGSAIQTDHDYTDGTIMQRNWVHDHIKFALRFDSPWLQPAVYGTNGIMRNNVLWNTRPMVPKGDYHHIYGNTGFANDVVDISIFSDITHGGINSNTVTRNNAVNLISGSRSAAEPYPGISDHNWSGSEVKNELVDAAQWDFRPAIGSALIDAGTNIPAQVSGFIGSAPDMGAYEFGHTNYWIPGYIAPQASMPIPNDGAVGQVEGRELIFQPGYKSVSVNVYFGTDSNSLPLLVNTPALHNIIDPRDHGVIPLGSTNYYWRADTVLADSSVVTGEVWNYSTDAFVPVLPGVIYSDDFEDYTVGNNLQPSNSWIQTTVSNGTIKVFDMAGDQTARLNNPASTDRTVLSAANAFAEQVLITLSFDSYHEGGTPVSGPMSLSAGTNNISSHLTQARKVSLASHITTNVWHHFDWVVNQSGAAVVYVVDGVTNSVAAGSADLWRDGTLVVDNGTDKPGNGNVLTDTTLVDSFGWTVNKADTADWRIDDVVVRNYAYAYVATATSPFEDWMTLYSVSGATNDPDKDGLGNLVEFALGGIPTNGMLTGHPIGFENAGGGFEYVYPRRKNSGLDYWLETSTNLVSGVWTNSGYTEHPVAGSINPDFDAVTNQIPTALDETFIRLRIEEL